MSAALPWLFLGVVGLVVTLVSQYLTIPFLIL